MKHLFSLLTLGWMRTLAWAQTDAYLSLEISTGGDTPRTQRVVIR